MTYPQTLYIKRIQGTDNPDDGFWLACDFPIDGAIIYIPKGTTTMYYKFLTDDNKGEYSEFDYSEYLPKRGKPGKWLPKVETVELCHSGYHACEEKNILDWRNAKLFSVELRGNITQGDDKVAGQEMRLVSQVKGWNEKNLHLAAADIVEEIALPVYKKYYPESTIIEDTIKVVRRFANGKATKKQLAAAGAAARDAARTAAWAAARAAARTAAWAAARDAAWDAARDAAWDAAGAAAWDAARDAAWDAARAAAWTAAWDAARDAARAAARDAAGDAAGAAAGDAARDAARDIISKRCGLQAVQ